MHNTDHLRAVESMNDGAWGGPCGRSDSTCGLSLPISLELLSGMLASPTWLTSRGMGVGGPLCFGIARVFRAFWGL